MAENPEFMLPSAQSVAGQLATIRTNTSLGNFFNNGYAWKKTFRSIFFIFIFTNFSLSEVSTVPDFQMLDVHPSKRADEDAQIHHLLEHAMFDARKTVRLNCIA